MKNKAPHSIIVLFLITLAHYTQVGAEMIEKALPDNQAPFRAVSSTALVISIWLLIALGIPWCCRLILAGYALVGHATDALCAWARAQAIELIKKLLERLGQ